MFDEAVSWNFSSWKCLNDWLINYALFSRIFKTTSLGHLIEISNDKKSSTSMQLRTSTPGVQRCVHMLLSLLRMMQYCINHKEWCNDLTFCMIFFFFLTRVLQTNGWTDRQTDGRTDRRRDRRTDKASYRDAWKHLKTEDRLIHPLFFQNWI